MKLIAEDRGLWQDALIRATEHRSRAGDALKIIRLSDTDGAASYLYRVPSYSMRGTFRSVSVVAAPRGWDGALLASDVKCDCPAGSAWVPCHHAAIAIEALGAWPWVMGRQPTLPGLS